MYKRIACILCLVIASVALNSCGEDPTSVGSSFGEPVAVSELISDTLQKSSENFKTSVRLETSDVLLLGSNRNVEASILIKFGLSSIPDTIKNQITAGAITVNSAKVQMFKIYSWGNANAALNYSVHPINSGWTLAGFSADSLPLLQYGSNAASGFDRENDSVYSFNLNTQLVDDWLKAEAGGNTAVNKGILLKPEGNNGLIVGFQGVALAAARSYVTMSVEYTKGTAKDTLTFYPDMDMHVVTGSFTGQGDESLVMQGSLAQRSRLLFDVSSLPKNTMIVNATLELSVDSSKSVFGTSLAGNRSRTDSIDVRFGVGGSEYDSTYAVVVPRSSGKYYANITNMVQKWSNGEANNGVILSLYYEKNTVDLLVLHGLGSPVINKRPRLKIIYATKQQ